MAYTDVTLIQNYLQREVTNDEGGYLSILIPAIKLWIDQKLDSTFDEATVATSRYYDGGCQSLDIHPCRTITSVASVDNFDVVNNTYTTDTYVLEPRNETIKREIKLRWSEFPCGTANIKVTGLFSEFDGGVPADIQNIATRLAGQLVRASHADLTAGDVKKESIEGHSVEYAVSQDMIDRIASNDPMVMSVLNLRRELYV